MNVYFSRIVLGLSVWGDTMAVGSLKDQLVKHFVGQVGNFTHTKAQNSQKRERRNIPTGAVATQLGIQASSCGISRQLCTLRIRSGGGDDGGGEKVISFSYILTSSQMFGKYCQDEEWR